MRQRKTIKSTTRQPVTGPPVLVVDGTRMFYRGHWTAAQRRRVGAHVLYLGLDAPFRIDLGNGWLTAEMAYVEPGLMHSMEGGGGSIGEVSLEAETLDRSDLPKPLGGTSGPIRAADEVERWRRACAAYRPPNPGAGTIGASIDEYFFGRPLRRRTLDTRIAAVVARITREPHQFHSALASARHCGLSTSRFQHLFTAQTGVPLRRFCGWKRARSLLEFVSNPASLTEIALLAGYADSTHFSHAIREFTGIKPKDIVAAMRGIPVVRPQEPAKQTATRIRAARSSKSAPCRGA